jgi:hypothetical protein
MRQHIALTTAATGRNTAPSNRRSRPGPLLLLLLLLLAVRSCRSSLLPSAAASCSTSWDGHALLLHGCRAAVRRERRRTMRPTHRKHGTPRCPREGSIVSAYSAPRPTALRGLPPSSMSGSSESDDPAIARSCSGMQLSLCSMAANNPLSGCARGCAAAAPRDDAKRSSSS